MKLGEKIKLVRKHRGLTQRELGERLHLDGNSPHVILAVFLIKIISRNFCISCLHSGVAVSANF